MNTALLAQAIELPVKERIALVEAIWDSIAEDAGVDVVPLPDWQREELERRLADFEANPQEGCSWEELDARLARREQHG